MKLKQRLLAVSAFSIVLLLLIVPQCDAARGGGSRKTSSSGRRGSSNSGSSSSGNSGSNSGGSWWSRMTGSGSSSSSSSSASKANSAATQRKPEPSAPRYEEKKPIGWNVPGVNSNPGAPPAYSNTHTKGLSNPNLQNAPPYSKNSPPGHQTIQSNNNPNQYAGLNYPRNTAQQSAGYPVQSNVPNQYQAGLNYPRNTGQQYSGAAYPGQGTGYYPAQGGGHYPAMNYPSHSAYPSYSGYNPAPGGYFASGYPVGNSNYGRSSSGSTLTNTLLAGSLGLGLYNAIRPYPSYSGGYGGGGYGGGGYGGGGSTVHNHYYNNQSPGSNPNTVQTAQAAAPVQTVPSNQNTNEPQAPLAPIPDQVGVPASNNNASSDPTNALVTPPPPTLAPNEKITDLDCVYAMKILNCSEIPQCPQEWIHPSCLNRTISKEYFDSITLPPPPPMPEAGPNPSEMPGKSSELTSLGQNQNGNLDPNLYSANNQQMSVGSSKNSSSRAVSNDYSMCLAMVVGIATVTNKFNLFV